MAKKISMKQQIYQQIANQQVQQVMSNQREQGIQQLQADFNAWQTRQNEIAQLQAEYDAWNAQNNPQPAPKQSIPSIANAQPQRDLQAEAKEYFANVRRQRREEEAAAKRLQEQQLKATINDYAKAQQEENMLASMSASKKKELKVGQRPEATDFSSQVAARKEEPARRGSEKWNKSVKDTLNMLNSKDMQAINKYQKVVKANEEKAAREVEQETPMINSGINQLDLSQYNLPQEDGISEQDRKAFDDYSKAVQWIDPNYRMTKEEQKEAKRIAAEGKQALAEKYPVANKADYGKLLDRMTPEDREKYLAFEDLGNKADSLASISVGAADKAVSTVGGLLNTTALFHPEAIPAAKKYKELQKKWDEMKQPSVELAQRATPLAENVPVIGEVTPYGVGQLATQIGAYLATNDVFDELGAMAFGGSKLGRFLGNQVGQNAQDMAVDTSQLISELAADGSLSDEDWKEIGANMRNNAIGNAVFGGAIEIPGLVKSGADNLAAKKAADTALKNNLAEGAENLAKAASEGPIFKDNSAIDAVKHELPTTPEPDGFIPTRYDKSNGVTPYTAHEIKNLSSGKKNIINDGNNFSDFVNRSIEKKGANQEKFYFGKVSDELNRDIKNAVGLNADNYDITIDSSHVWHDYKEHGLKVDSEINQGQIPVTPETISELQKVFDKPDTIVKLPGNDSSKHEVIRIGKRVDGHWYITEGYADNKNALVIDSFIIRKTPLEADSAKMPSSLRPKPNNQSESLSDSNITNAIEDVNKNSVKSSVPNDLAPRADGIDITQLPGFEYRQTEGIIEDNGQYMRRPREGSDVNWYESAPDRTTPYSSEELAEIKKYAETSKENNQKLTKMLMAGEGKSEAYNQLNKANWELHDLTLGKYPELFTGDTFKGVPEVKDQYKTMAEEISRPKSEKITSEPIEPGKYEIPDTPENAPKGTTEDLWDELKKGEQKPATSEANTPKATQEINEQGQKLSRLHSTLQNTDKLTEAEKKTFYDKNGFWYDPDVERELAANTQKEIEDIGLDAMYDRYMGGDMSGKTLSGQDSHNMITTSFDYNKMAQEALQNGDEALAKLYESKARNIMLQARETATDYGKFNAAIAYYSRTPQGYIDKAYEQMSKQISDFKGNNPKLANDIDRFAKQFADDLKDVDVDAIMSGSDEAAKQSLRQQVYDSLEKMLKDASPQAKQKFSNLSDAELDDIIVSKYEKDLARTLDMFSMGSYGVKPETVDKVLDLFAEAEKYDISSKQYYKAEKEAFDLLANDLMSGNGKSFREKFDAWRYFAMLANPLTHAKNIGGNINNKVLVGVKNNIAAALEDAADKAAKAKGRSGIEGGRTKAFLSLKNDGALLDGAGEFFDQHAYREFKQGGNKWINVGQELANAGDTFSNKRLAGRVANKLTEGNTNILDAEDIIAGKATFKTSMAGFLKANGADASIFTKTDDASKQLLEQAKTYALQQANEATFHQTNELAQAISRFIKEGKKSPSTARRIFSGALDFMVPFVKTPGNILKACFEYSPLEFIQVAKETKAWMNGAVSTSKYIDDISKGLTGSAGLGIGALLSAAGILNVSSGNDTEDTFNKKRGITTPSIRLGNASFKISELAPGAMPLIIGATVYETIKNSKKSADAAADTIFNGLSAIGDTVTDMTMLSGIASTLNDIRYAKDNTEMWGKLGLGIATNAAGQVLPTIGRKIEQTVDDTARSTYSGQDSALLRSLDSNAKYWKTKVPMLQEIGEGLEKSNNQHIANIGDFLTNEPQINAWGEEIKNPDYNLSKLNKGLGYLGRGVHNTLDVFDTQINSSNKLDNSLRELASKIEDQDTKDKVLKYGLQPSTYDASVDGQRMSEKQWTEYQKGLGKTKSDLLNSLISSDSYEKMSPEDKAATLDLMSNFAKNYNQDKVVGKELDSFNKKLADLYGKGKIDDVVKTIRDKQTVNAAGYDYKEGSAAVEAIKDMDEEARQEYVETSNNLNDYGLTSQSAQATWDKVQKTFGKKHKTIPTMDEFVKTYNAMDTDGNKSLKQDELCNYFTKNGFSQSDANLYWEAYGGSKWKQVPVLEGNKWTHK